MNGIYAGAGGQDRTGQDTDTDHRTMIENEEPRGTAGTRGRCHAARPTEAGRDVQARCMRAPAEGTAVEFAERHTFDRHLKLWGAA